MQEHGDGEVQKTGEGAGQRGWCVGGGTGIKTGSCRGLGAVDMGHWGGDQGV